MLATKKILPLKEIMCTTSMLKIAIHLTKRTYVPIKSNLHAFSVMQERKKQKKYCIQCLIIVRACTICVCW